VKQKTRRVRLGFALVIAGGAILAGSLSTGMAAATVATSGTQDSRSTIETTVASTSASTDWKVQAGKRFQRAGEYTVRRSNNFLQDAIDAYGPPSSCKINGSRSYGVATWATRGIRIYDATLGGLPAGETACTSPDLVYVSEIRLTDRRWTTSFGLHVGDPTTKLRKLYPKSPYVPGAPGSRWSRNIYTLVWQRVHCDFDCSSYEQVHGTDIARLTAQVMNGRVTAFWIPVFGEGE
jgi:hypothetical protein